LPGKELPNDVVSIAIQSLQLVSVLGATKAIMKTDRFPKVRGSKTLSNEAQIVGIAKGDGMIEIKTATMLSFILTDAKGRPSEKSLQCGRCKLQLPVDGW
jgi:N-acetylglutamate synthase/N-acetylornithine aminotransferase